MGIIYLKNYIIAYLVCGIILIVFSMSFINDISSWVDGPTTQSVRTSGVFKPGGAVRVIFEPGISSIRGRYIIEGNVIPHLTDQQIRKGIVWHETMISEERKWGNKITSNFGKIYESRFSIRFFIPIPSNVSLIGDKVHLKIKSTISYPKIVGQGRFENRQVEFEEDMILSIMGPDKASFGDNVTIWKRRTKFGSILNIVSVVVALLTLLVIIGLISTYKDLPRN